MSTSRMACNQDSPYQHLDFPSSTKPDNHLSNGDFTRHNSHIASDLTTHSPDGETLDQGPINLSYVQQQQNLNQDGVTGTLFGLSSADIASGSSAVHQPSPVKQDQLIPLRPAPHPSPVANQRTQVSLTPLLSSQQQPVTELHHLSHSSVAVFTTPHAQESPQPAAKLNHDVQSERAAADQGAISSSSERIEQSREPVEPPGTLCPPHLPAKSGLSDQEATAAQHEQFFPTDTLCYQPWEDSILVSPLRKRERSASSSSDEHGRGQPLLSSYKNPLMQAQSNRSTAVDPPRDASLSPASDTNQAKHDKGKVPTDPVWVRESLEAYNMFQDHDDAYTRYPALGRKVEKILARKRQSGVTAEEYQEFKLTLSEYRDSNEDTMVNEVLPFLIKETRKVPPNRAPKNAVGMDLDEGEESTDGNEYSDLESEPDSIDELIKQDQTILRKKADFAEDEVWVSVSFLRSGVVRITNREFWRAPVPSRFPDDLGLDKDLLKAMAKEDKLSNPKPDRVYGVSRKKFKWPAGFRIPSVVRIYLDVMRSCHHIYLINEAKSAGGDIREARNQACRDGTAVVLSARELWALLGEKDVVGADLRTIVFSMVMSPETVEIWVHWAEVPRKTQSGQISKRPIYHMNMVRSESINNKMGMEKLRACLHNIIDWGVGLRWEELQPLYAKIIEYGRKQDEKELSKGQGSKVQKSKGPGK
ncbi:MAG: hypothetical protein Q9197_006614 [Variospora fuerteventurae]